MCCTQKCNKLQTRVTVVPCVKRLTEVILKTYLQI